MPPIKSSRCAHPQPFARRDRLAPGGSCGCVPFLRRPFPSVGLKTLRLSGMRRYPAWWLFPDHRPPGACASPSRASCCRPQPPPSLPCPPSSRATAADATTSEDGGGGWPGSGERNEWLLLPHSVAQRRTQSAIASIVLPLWSSGCASGQTERERRRRKAERGRGRGGWRRGCYGANKTRVLGIGRELYYGWHIGPHRHAWEEGMKGSGSGENI